MNTREGFVENEIKRLGESVFKILAPMLCEFRIRIVATEPCGLGRGAPIRKLIAMGFEAVLLKSNDRGYQDSRAD